MRAVMNDGVPLVSQLDATSNRAGEFRRGVTNLSLAVSRGFKAISGGGCA
jgi:hypothetical protein